MLGQTFGTYRILSHLGSGGMADVYLAEDTRSGQWVALKTLPRIYRGNPKLISRFEREISSLRRLDHPNIIRILDEGQTDGLPYYVMEYVPGPTLAEQMRASGPFAPDRMIEIASAICSALEYAHSMGIVHRDIKPANIIVSPTGDIKVADFGIAQAMDRTRLTSAGAKGIGTPQYMSPEQIRGERADGRSDLYSLGILMFELLTGSVPFSGKTPIEIAVKQMEETPPEPRTIVPAIPEWLSNAVLRLLKKDRKDRFQNAKSVLRTLSSKADETKRLESGKRAKHPLTSDLWVLVPWGGIIIILAVFLVGSWMEDSFLVGSSIGDRKPPKSLTSIPGAHPEWKQDSESEIGIKRITRVDRVSQPISSCSWSPDGKMIALAMADSNELENFDIYVLDLEDSQPPKRITSRNDRVIAFTRLHWLPDGKNLVFERLKTESPEFIALPCKIEIDQPHPATVLTQERWTSYIPTRRSDNNYYAIANEEGIKVVPIDLAGNIRGNPETISSLPLYGSSISNGLDKMLAIKVNAPDDRDSYLLNDVDRILSGEHPPIASFDDARLVCLDGSRNFLENALFSVDGTYVFYTRDVSGRWTDEMGETGQQARQGGANADFEIMYARADGTGVPRRLFFAPHNQFCPSISPDGSQLAFISYHPAGKNDENERWELLIADLRFSEANRKASPSSFQTGFDSEDLDEWEITTGNWAASDGVLASSGVFGEEIILKDRAWENCRISFRMRFRSGIEDFWVRFRSNYQHEPRGYSYYQIDGGSGKIRHNDLKGWTDISEIVSVPKGDRDWHTIELSVRGSVVECFRDGNRIVSTQRCQINVGAVGFRTLNTKVEIDDLLVEKLTLEEPYPASSETDMQGALYNNLDYYPLHVGNRWTYRSSDGGTITRTVAGTNVICGRTCARFEWSNARKSWWITDQLGTWLVRIQGTDGISTTFCIEQPIMGARVPTGYSKTIEFENAVIRDSNAIQLGTAMGSLYVTFDNVEAVTTPAGTFDDCMHAKLVITLSTQLRGGSTTVLASEDWFAKGIGLVKQITDTGEVLILESATVNGVRYSSAFAAISQTRIAGVAEEQPKRR